MAMQPSCPMDTVDGIIEYADGWLMRASKHVQAARDLYKGGVRNRSAAEEAEAALDAVGYAGELLRRLAATIDEEAGRCKRT